MMNNSNILERQSNEEFSIGAKFLEAKSSYGQINFPPCVHRDYYLPDYYSLVPSVGFAQVNFDGASGGESASAIKNTAILPGKINHSSITTSDEDFYTSLEEKTSLIPLSPDAKASRMPQNPIVLLKALQDPVPYEFGESRPAKTRKSRKSGRD